MALTAAELVTLLEGPGFEVDAGLDLLDADENFVADISEFLVPSGSFVDRGVYRTLHGSGTLVLSTEIDWGSQRLRPWMSITDGTLTETWYLGVYLPSTPVRPLGETPITYTVQCFDKLEILNHPYGSSYALASGAVILDAVADLISGAGESKLLVDSDEAATTLASARVWPIDPETSTLSIVNDLLGMIGYRSLWVDRDGYYRASRYVEPSGLAPVWTFSAQSTTTTVGESRMFEADYFSVPNRWVFIRNDPESGLPATDDGLYVVTNQSDGATSIDARGRTITRVEFVDAATQAALESQGDRMVEADKRLIQRTSITAAPNPVMWHFDAVTYVDSEVPTSDRWLVTDWTLPLDGADMTIELKKVSA